MRSGRIIGAGLVAASVALAIFATLIFQALPAEWLARRLGLLDGEVVQRAV